MSTLTPNFALVKPDPADVIIDLSNLNNNATTIDTELQNALGSSAVSKAKLQNHNNIVVNTAEKTFVPGSTAVKLETIAATGPIMIEYWLAISVDTIPDSLRFWATSSASWANACMETGPSDGGTWNFKSDETQSLNQLYNSWFSPDVFNLYKARYFCTDTVPGSVYFQLGGVDTDPNNVCTLHNYTMRRWSGV